MRSHIKPYILPLMLTLTSFPVAQSGDWDQWRGPGRDGRMSFSAPTVWPESPLQKWRIKVGEGHSAPIIVGDRIYMHARIGDEEVVQALGLENGESIWSSAVVTPYEMDSAALDHGKGPKSTPVFWNGNLYTFGISGVLTAFRAEAGEILWRRDFSGEYAKTSPLFGVAMSPLVVEGRVIAHVGGHDKGALTAFEAQTGEEVWSWDGDGPGYSSPVVFEVGGTRQIVTQSQDKVIAVDVETGRLLWSQPFSTAYYQNSVTPLVIGDAVLISGLDQGISSLRPRLEGNNWVVDEVWKTTRAAYYMSTPVLVNHRICGLSHKRRGQILCLDPASGDMVWGSRGRDGENASFLASDDVIMLLNTDGDLIVLDPKADEFAPIASYKVADTPTWAHLVVHDKTFLVKDFEHLTAWTFESTGRQ